MKATIFILYLIWLRLRLTTPILASGTKSEVY